MQEQLRTLSVASIGWSKHEAFPKVKGWEVVVPSTHEGKLLADTLAIGSLLDDKPQERRPPGFVWILAGV